MSDHSEDAPYHDNLRIKEFCNLTRLVAREQALTPNNREDEEMLALTLLEIESVSGGDGAPPPPAPTTPPICTTSGSTTTCTCPAGYSLAAGSDGKVALIDCVKRT